MTRGKRLPPIFVDLGVFACADGLADRAALQVGKGEGWRGGGKGAGKGGGASGGGEGDFPEISLWATEENRMNQANRPIRRLARLLGVDVPWKS